MLKAIILIEEPKATKCPGILPVVFPIAGIDMIQHQIEACANIRNLSEMFIIGPYEASSTHSFIYEMRQKCDVIVKYLQHPVPTLGSAGNIYHLRDEIYADNPKHIFILKSNVCANFPLKDLLNFHKSKEALITVVTTDITKQEFFGQRKKIGNIVLGPDNEVLHCVENPTRFVSNIINCGIYVTTITFFQIVSNILFKNNYEGKKLKNIADRAATLQGRPRYSDTTEGIEKKTLISRGDKDAETKRNPAYINLEQDVLSNLAGSGRLFAFPFSDWWVEVLFQDSDELFAHRKYLEMYRHKYPERLVELGSRPYGILGNVYIHKSAKIHPAVVLGPNVSVGRYAKITEGVKIRESIVGCNYLVQPDSVTRLDKNKGVTPENNNM